MPPHPAPQEPRASAGLDKLNSSQRRGNPASGVRSPLCGAAGLVTHPPPLGFLNLGKVCPEKYLFPETGATRLSLQGREKYKGYKLLAGRAGFSLGFLARRRSRGETVEQSRT